MINILEEYRDKIINISDVIKYIKILENTSVKEYLENIFGGFILGSCIDETDDLLLINSKKLLENIDYHNQYFNILSNSASIIIEKKTNDIIIEYYNNAKSEIEEIKRHDWNSTYITYIYPGINIILFFYKNKWELVCESFIENNNYIENYGYINDIYLKLCKSIDLNSLKEDYYYQFIYQNNKSKNYIDNCLINNLHEEFIYVSAHEKYNYKLINYDIQSINKIQQLHFSCLDELMIKLDFISYENKVNKTLSYAGFNIKVYNNNYQINNFNIYTEIYNQIKKQFIDGNNIYKIYLELYQKNYLNDILPYLSKYPNEIIHRLNMSMKTLSREILNVYHTTRKKKHQELYKLLPELYKKILYGLHGLYINSRKKDIINRPIKEYDETKSITVHDVYYFIKEMTAYQLIELFKERTELLKNPNFNNIMNHDCIYTLTQAKLMLKDDEKIIYKTI